MGKNEKLKENLEGKLKYLPRGNSHAPELHKPSKHLQSQRGQMIDQRAYILHSWLLSLFPKYAFLKKNHY